ncbi:glycosyltransferase [Urechidicola croceus]|uniref:Glycosyltransferase n=1 Tax=Urechidicola croceus TaxID=1850246 RepID=A0A1D8P9E8_9FLAO|nr:glycosyltransferase [Urechidicola croceus]AOW21178.1 glycosyltransferase [Urechidicola croceus]
MISNKNILVSPLNWGLGHASRCIPIINELIKSKFNPIIASDGDALSLLQKEFPKLESIELPSYNINYPKNGNLLKWKLILDLPSVLKVIKKEKKIVDQLVESKKLIGIISDNRFGIRSSKVPSVFITHQLNVLSGSTTFLTSKLHQKYINKFDECWIPDIDSDKNYAGVLSRSKKIKNPKFIGLLSRFRKEELVLKYDLLVLLSGVEPLRSQLEKRIISELKNYSGKVLFIKGKIENKQTKEIIKNITFYNYLLTDELQKAINQSELIIARSGYSTIMDLAVLGKKVYFIPTTGQYEQEYLAKHLKRLSIAPFAKTKNFTIKTILEVENYNGFTSYKKNDFSDLLNLFQSK